AAERQRMPPKEKRGIHDHAKKLHQAATFSERIQAIGYNSGTWSSKEDEKFGIEKLSAAHSRQGYARCKRMFADTEVDMELDAATRGAAADKKRKVDSEVDGFLAEAQGTAVAGQPSALLAAPASGPPRQGAKAGSLSQLVVVRKKQRARRGRRGRGGAAGRPGPGRLQQQRQRQRGGGVTLPARRPAPLGRAARGAPAAGCISSPGLWPPRVPALLVAASWRPRDSSLPPGPPPL
ncbi:unnamed protein product, partial [Prorocentrum cordatum]